MSSKPRSDIARGVMAGVAGGLVASFVMNQFQGLLAKVKPDKEEAAKPDAADDPATVKVAEPLLGRELRTDEKEPAGNAVHYAFGAAVGGLYGALAETAPASRTGLGAVFGSALWLVVDEIAVPAFGLSEPAGTYPASVHASAWASHLVYGITTDLVRRGLRAM